MYFLGFINSTLVNAPSWRYAVYDVVACEPQGRQLAEAAILGSVAVPH